MNDLVGYMGFLEIALKVWRNSQNWAVFRKIANFGGDFKGTHVSYEVVHGDQYCLEWCIWFVYQFWGKSDNFKYWVFKLGLKKWFFLSFSALFKLSALLQFFMKWPKISDLAFFNQNEESERWTAKSGKVGAPATP